jgi:parvulin-like peptidyl-prolyl isomerase
LNRDLTLAAAEANGPTVINWDIGGSRTAHRGPPVPPSRQACHFALSPPPFTLYPARGNGLTRLSARWDMDAGTRWRLRRGVTAAVALGAVAANAGCSVRSLIPGPISRLQAPDDEPPVPPAVTAPERPPAAPAIQAATLKLAETATPRVRVVAVIGSDSFITDDEVWQLVRMRLIGKRGPEGGETPAAAKAREQKLFDESLRALIEREIVLADWVGKIKKNKPQALDELKAEAQSSAKRTFKQFRLGSNAKTEEEFLEGLKYSGLSYTLLMRQLEREAMLSLYMQSFLKDKGETIPTGAVERFFADHADEFRSEEKLKWLDLFVSTRRFNSDADARAFAEWLHQQAADPTVDFVALVKQHGHGTSPLADGVGIGRKLAEVRPAELVPTIKALKPGQVSGVVPGEGGYHVVKLVEYDAGTLPPFDEKVQSLIRRKLLADSHERERNKLVEELRRRTTVKIYDENR